MSDHHVTLYSGPEPAAMAGARRYLDQLGIQYEEKDVVASTGARGELLHQLGRVEYPSINVDGHTVAGFFPEKWDHLLQNPASQENV